MIIVFFVFFTVLARCINFPSFIFNFHALIFDKQPFSHMLHVCTTGIHTCLNHTGAVKFLQENRHRIMEILSRRWNWHQVKSGCFPALLRRRLFPHFRLLCLFWFREHATGCWLTQEHMHHSVQNVAPVCDPPEWGGNCSISAHCSAGIWNLRAERHF